MGGIAPCAIHVSPYSALAIHRNTPVIRLNQPANYGISEALITWGIKEWGRTEDVDAGVSSGAASPETGASRRTETPPETPPELPLPLPLQVPPEMSEIMMS